MSIRNAKAHQVILKWITTFTYENLKNDKRELKKKHHSLEWRNENSYLRNKFSGVKKGVRFTVIVRDTFESPNIWWEPRLLGSLRVWATWKWCRYPVWVSWKHSWQWALGGLWISWQWLALDIQEGWDILCVTRYHFCVIPCERVCQVRNQCLHLRLCQHACIDTCVCLVPARVCLNSGLCAVK